MSRCSRNSWISPEGFVVRLQPLNAQVDDDWCYLMTFFHRTRFSRGPLLRCLRLDVNGEANSSRFFRSNSAFRPEANQKQIAAEWAIRRSNEFLDWLEFEDSYEQQLGELLQFLVRWSHEITKPLHQQQEYMEVQRTTGDLSLSLRNVESHECKSSGEAQR
ncbi:hypothetical protein HPP92_029116 [Vanilla planifolia]|uniref:Uncharacterized protein n=1 Tax=Vanilla planifolia TaxID=51239 RepID=A0A835U2F3_VANPL|nr:hypothetical protein HPP92_029116 [Vanilla planifolia]